MLKSLQIASKGLLGQVLRNDVIANNLANAATNGFKREVSRVTAEVSATNAETQELTVSSVTDHARGYFRHTGGELDIAIEGDGFFVVEKDGEELYTKVGSFRLDDIGQIVTESGYALQGSAGPMTIDIEEGKPTIATDGTVTVGEVEKGLIKVVRFEDPLSLTRAGGSLFAAGTETPLDLEPTEVRLLTGFIEGSNVNPVREMVSMISALRTYQVMEKSIQSADQILDTMINRVGKIQGAG